MRKLLEKIAPWAFAAWTIGIMSAYFFFYQNYGQAFSSAFLLIIFLSLFFVPLTFFASLPFVFRGKIFPPILWIQRAPSVISVSAKSLVVTFFGCIASWIAVIFLINKDVGIAANSIVSVFLVFLITISGFSLGSAVINRSNIRCESFLERFTLSTLLGFGVLMLVMYVLGMVGLLYSTIAYVIIIGTLLFFRREWLGLAEDIRSTSLKWHIKPFFTLENFAIIASFILFVFATTGFLCQFAAGWDEMHTYQAFPHAYAEAHRIVNFKYWFMNGFPQNTEMLFTLGFLLKGFTTAAGINTAFYFLLAGVLILIQRLVFPRASSTLVPLLFALSAIPYLMIATDHKIDLAFWTYSLLSTFFLIKFDDSRSHQDLILLSLFAGISAGMKYNFFSIILPSSLIILFFFQRESDWKRRFVNASLSVAIIAACFSPWAVKNILFSGNPVDPALGDTLSSNRTFFKQIGRSYSEHLREQFSDANIWSGNQEKKGIEFYILFPFNETFHFQNKDFTDIENIGPLILIFLPIIFFSRKSRRFLFGSEKSRNRKSFLIITIILLQFLSWAFLSNLFPWYIFSAILLLIPLWSQLFEIEEWRLMKLLMFCGIITLSLSTVLIRLDETLRNGVLFQTETTREFHQFQVAQYINENCRSGLIWEGHGPSLNYYVKSSSSRLIYDYYDLIFHFLEKRNSDGISEELKSLGVRYFIFKENDANFWMNLNISAQRYSPISSKMFERSLEAYTAFKDEKLTEIFRSGDIGLYTFKEDAR